MKLRTLFIAGLSTFAAFASADTFLVNLDVSGTESWDEIYDSDNFDFVGDVGSLFPGYTDFVMTGIGWDNVNIETVGASWLSEATFSFESFSGGDWLDVNPGVDDDNSGNATYSSGGLIDLASIDPELPLILDPDNLLYFHIYEAFDDNPDAVDAFIHSGTFTLQFEATAAPVPEPASMLALGLGAVALLRKRSKK